MLPVLTNCVELLNLKEYVEALSLLSVPLHFIYILQNVLYTNLCCVVFVVKEEVGAHGNSCLTVPKLFTVFRAEPQLIGMTS